MSYLRNENKIDFDDMILQAIDELDKTNNFKYKYIIVDEFQDISFSRMKFLQKLIEHGNSKLFAVGDDWQAIYRFSGCDLNIFLRFSDYFGDCAITKITTTHRNSQELQDIAGPFIKANPEQFNKKINSSLHLEHPVQIMYYSKKKYYAFLDVLKEIAKLNKEAKVLVLGRNNKDFEDIALDSRIYIDFKKSSETKTVINVRDFPKMQISFSTVHASKGLEEDYVVIINADDSRLGFPNKMEDDELLDMVLSSKSKYQYAEERRLWYVALTRTRNYTYIIANNENPSVFVKEIEKQCLVLNSDVEENNQGEILCPHCKTGRLILRTNESDQSKFYGCSNYPYCNYSISDFRAVKRNRRCPYCGDIMVFKKGPYGAFYGCHNYPRCKHKEEYDGK
jgi:DNA helicase-4